MSDEPAAGFSYISLRDHAFTVEGGSVVSARRLAPPGNVRWEMTIRATGDDDVAVTLPVTTNCATSGAICTADGRTLSAEVSLTVAGPGRLPGAPQGLEGVSNSNGTITLTWEAPEGDPVTGYQILRRKPRIGETSLEVYVDNTNSTETTYTDTNASTGTLYVYRVKAVNSVGVGPQSGYANVEH